MGYLSVFVRWMTLSSEDSDYLMVQHNELRRQIPLLYALLIINVIAAGAINFDHSSMWMSVGIPAFLVAFCVVRISAWLRQPATQLTPPVLLRRLRATIALAVILSVVFVIWALGLVHDAGVEGREHAALFIALSVMGCVFCLLHLPQAALCVAAIALVPYTIQYLSTEVGYTSIALNIFLFGIVACGILINSYLAFANVARSRIALNRLQGELLDLAHIDALTTLPNRLAFFNELARMQKDQTVSSGDVSVGIIDLDLFKAANDTFGHRIGDQLLQAVGQRLKERIPTNGMIARLGGDEFALAVRVPAAEALRIADELCLSLSNAYQMDGFTISLGASCGVAAAEADDGDVLSIYERADYALYHSKASRRGMATLYSPQLKDRAASERAVEAALQTCDIEAELDNHFQPIFDVASGKITTVEALARWTHPELGPIRPDIFIPLAERLGLIHRITMSLFGKALAHGARLPETIGISFNLSAHDLASHQTILALVSAIRRAQFDPSRVVFELTETAVIKDYAVARRSLDILHALGARIALDDFGTGQSNLGYLHELPIDKLKIDRSFVSGTQADNRKLVLSAIVALGHTLGLRCVAEGVETEEQLELLRLNGCDAFQGYFGAKPMPIDDLLRTLRSIERAPEQAIAV